MPYFIFYFKNENISKENIYRADNLNQLSEYFLNNIDKFRKLFKMIMLTDSPIRKNFTNFYSQDYREQEDHDLFNKSNWNKSKVRLIKKLQKIKPEILFCDIESINSLVKIKFYCIDNIDVAKTKNIIDINKKEIEFKPNVSRSDYLNIRSDLELEDLISKSNPRTYMEFLQKGMKILKYYYPGTSSTTLIQKINQLWKLHQRIYYSEA
ncbi:hypothetical protein QKC54_gp0123 [Megavirus baoshan]|uniref:Uncharacterized protein n=1 Tax=Megavirus baoshan TaxID=2496520 RepID=A0A3Q8U8J4_9VIRU|nr:hypothetical protein QKC54_gp0123 [Megavirus baoshan]AZL89790.1 hypothetical protein Mb0949 [Megavirus baoshan]